MTTAKTLLAETMRVVLAPRERPDPDRWADANRVIPSRAADRPGRWDTGVTPYFREPFRTYLDPQVRRLTMIKSAQIGASEWIINLILYTLAVQGRNALVVYPREEEARKFLVKRIRPSIELCRAFDELRTGRAHDEKTTEVVLKNAQLSVKWAHAGGGVKSDPCPAVFGDEADDFPAGTSDQLESRTTTFVDAKVLEASTPSFEHIGIHATYEQSDRRRFLVPCPVSGEFFELYDLSLVRWEGGVKTTPEEVERTAYVQSPFVAGREGRIYEASKAWMIANGVWVREGEHVEGKCVKPQSTQSGTEEGIGLVQDQGISLCDSVPSVVNVLSSIPGDVLRREGYGGVRIVGKPTRPGARHAGFRLNSLVSPWISWGKVAAEFVERKGEPDAKWINDRLGQPWQAPGQKVEAKELRALATPRALGGYRTGQVPPGCLLLATMIDVQHDHAWVAVWGYGSRARDLYFIAHRKVPAPEGGDLAELDFVHAAERWSFEGLGARMRPSVVGIDHGHRPKEVRRFAARAGRDRKKVLMLKGDGTSDRHWLVREGQDDAGAPILLANTSALKDWASGLMSPRMAVHAAYDEQVTAGRLHLPEDVEEDVLMQLTAEHRVSTDAKGRPLAIKGRQISRWEKKPGRKDNHLFDLMYMSLAVAEALGLEALDEKTVAAVRAGR